MLVKLPILYLFIDHQLVYLSENSQREYFCENHIQINLRYYHLGVLIHKIELLYRNQQHTRPDHYFYTVTGSG